MLLSVTKQQNNLNVVQAAAMPSTAADRIQDQELATGDLDMVSSKDAAVP